MIDLKTHDTTILIKKETDEPQKTGRFRKIKGEERKKFSRSMIS